MYGRFVEGRPGYTIKVLVMVWGFCGHDVYNFFGGSGEMMLSISVVVYGHHGQKSLWLAMVPLYCNMITSLQISNAYQQSSKYGNLAIVAHLAVGGRQANVACKCGCGP